jgi:hypothetical protein
MVTSKFALVPLLTVSSKAPAPSPAGRSATIWALLDDIRVSSVPSRCTVGEPVAGVRRWPVMVIWLCTRSATALTTTGALEAAGDSWANIRLLRATSRQAAGSKCFFMRWVRLIEMLLTRNS